MNLPAKAWRTAVACMLAAAMSVTAVPATADSRTDRDRLILLGTKGGPSVRDVDQVPTSNAVVLGKDTYLVDAGYGAALRLVEARIPLTSVRAILLTHHHSDHNLDVGPLIYSDCCL
ncbi:MBL fold metallo-hydrolase [Cupriavidus gilardii]|uniref:MBL fold metallo-hydrolase n=1 Tax=Cupriavidus gilardii TaxID=82541 RepID=UPI0021C0E20A|nr:MBL fold metallo-hydrolase [Cupriavidus gilardii]MCT9124573.1 MBL fold metallo-hydrolase [Cupriavidus gilardii]